MGNRVTLLNTTGESNLIHLKRLNLVKTKPKIFIINSTVVQLYLEN